jgi:hypothetical protein
MYDFTLIKTGEEFELLCEDLLKAKGLDIQSRPSRGPDGGADMIAAIVETGALGFRQEYRILIECKHFAGSGRSVRESDVGSIIERVIRHNCNRYLLITSTIPSVSVSQQLQAISNNPSIHMSAAVWSINNLQDLLTQFPDVAAKHFDRKDTSRDDSEDLSPRHVIAIHLHPDFANDINIALESWNSCQSYYAFIPLRPPRNLEEVLLSPNPILVADASKLANKISMAAGFQSDDGLIQFCEGRLHDSSYYQLFSSTSINDGKLNHSTISLNMKRKLATTASLDSPVFSMILQSILAALGFAINLNSHKVTRGCIMDFNNEMDDIIIGLQYGPKFCPHCEEKIKKGGRDFLLFLAKASREIIHKSSSSSMMPVRMKLREKRQKEFGGTIYDVALSFAGEDRACAERLANELKTKGVRVFYDGFEKAALWGEDLFSYLDELYRFRAIFCVMFISKQYAEKLWTNHERKAAQAKAFTENRAYILPIKLDDTDIPGMPPTVGYLSWDSESVENIAAIILMKLREYKSKTQE